MNCISEPLRIISNTLLAKKDLKQLGQSQSQFNSTVQLLSLLRRQTLSLSNKNIQTSRRNLITTLLFLELDGLKILSFFNMRWTFLKFVYNRAILYLNFIISLFLNTLLLPIITPICRLHDKWGCPSPSSPPPPTTTPPPPPHTHLTTALCRSHNLFVKARILLFCKKFLPSLLPLFDITHMQYSKLITMQVNLFSLGLLLTHPSNNVVFW